ncbi:MAG: putative esterase [Hyphomonadaceae bacterium]|nr:MAG: putative esterase [Hyphomonadaceae bacterium]KAF0187059.1 MAG: putative esterase [Hyphomonadaceae bacterium]
MSVQVSGYVANGFERVFDQFNENFIDGLELGAGFCVQIEGEVVVDLVGGFADRAKENKWDSQTLVPIYSTTKAIAGIVIARLMDKGLLTFDDKVSKLWPEFAAHGKDVTIAQAMSHQAGVPGFANPIDPALWLDPPKLAAELAKLAPMWEVGTKAGYHPLTWGYIVGELAMRAEGRSLGSQLRDDICAPLGIDFWIGLPEAEHDRCAQIEKPREAPALGDISPLKQAAFWKPWSAPNRGGRDWREAEIPSANGHGTAKSVATLYGIFANDGEILGRQIVSKPTMKEFTKERIRGQDLVLPFDMHWAAGLMINNNHFYGPNPNSLGHSGWGGSCGFGDPARRIACAYVMNKQSSYLAGDSRATSLIEALYGCL